MKRYFGFLLFLLLFFVITATVKAVPFIPPPPPSPTIDPNVIPDTDTSTDVPPPTVDTPTNDTKAIPKPVVPCDPRKYKDPEFNSSRPYQASPCRDPESYAVMCSNNIKVTIAHVGCSYSGSPTCTCSTGDCEATKHVVIDLSGVKLPILGNTQDVANSKTGKDGFDDAQKMNEYVSWYLSGASQKAEYGTDTADKLINFSGPAKKLLPQVEQELFRYKSLKEAGEKDLETNDYGNHNQIVLCTTHNIFGINNPWIGEEKPTPCYDGNGAKANGKKYRLAQWLNGNLSTYNTVFNFLLGWTGNSAWNDKTPPFPWQFSDPIYYQKAYNEWRGLQCSLADNPVTGIFASVLGKKLLCLDVPWVTKNTWSDFYQYIPLSNPVDMVGEEKYGSATVEGQGKTTIESSSTNIIKSPNLFYSHTVESAEAVANLNKTFVPKEGVSTSTIPVNTEENTDSCQILDVRTNAGDDLTFSNTKSKQQIVFDVSYKVGQVECRQSSRTKSPCVDPATGKKIAGCTATPYEIVTWDCSSDITASIDLTTNSPYVDKIWQDTTGGAGSTFRKIFPKVMEGAPVSCLADIPGVSSATYNLNGASDPSVSGLDVKNPGGSTATSPEIYFPHLGSVYEYFLKGIQTALRPQGYGEPITNGTNCVPTVGTGACKQWLFENNNYNKVIAAAQATTCNGKSLNPAWALGIALNENGGLMSDKLDGSSNSHFGCNMGQVQSIDAKIACMTNTLRNDCLAGKTDAQTLQEYGYAPGYVLDPIVQIDPSEAYPPPLFGGKANTSNLISRLLSVNWGAYYAGAFRIFCPNSL